MVSAYNMNIFSHFKIARANMWKKTVYKLFDNKNGHLFSRHKLGISSLSRQVLAVTRSSSLFNRKFCVLTGGSKILSKNGRWIDQRRRNNVCSFQTSCITWKGK